jgi:hypothetical protein
VCHNFQQPGHYARDCPLPPVTCMYCRATDHDTEDCPTLLGKIQEKRNQNNQNVQWISVEARDDGRNINIVTRGGAKTGTDAVSQIQINTNGLRRTLSHISSLTRGKKRKHLRKPDRSVSRRMLHLHQSCNNLKTHQYMGCHSQWTIPIKNNL